MFPGRGRVLYGPGPPLVGILDGEAEDFWHGLAGAKSHSAGRAKVVQSRFWVPEASSTARCVGLDAGGEWYPNGEYLGYGFYELSTYQNRAIRTSSGVRDAPRSIRPLLRLGKNGYAKAPFLRALDGALGICGHRPLGTACRKRRTEAEILGTSDAQSCQAASPPELLGPSPVQVHLHGPSYDSAVPHVWRDAHVQQAFPGRDLQDIGHPEVIRPGRPEVPAHRASGSLRLPRSPSRRDPIPRR